LKELIETENSHDVEKVLSLLADDIVFEDVTFGVVMKGKDGEGDESIIVRRRKTG
jgi:ketosteroid isomerase-like protein